MNSRVSQLRALMSGDNLSHALITDNTDIEYISGFRSSNATLLLSQEKGYLFTDFRYRSVAQEFCAHNPLYEFIEIKDKNYRFLSQYLKKGSVAGIQTNVLTMDHYRELKKACEGVRFVSISEHLLTISVTKFPEEISSMQKAAQIGDRAFEAVLPKIRLGMTEIELAKSLDSLCSEFGSEKPSFDTIVLFGKRTALPHGRPGKSRLAPNDLILFDFGCTVENFCSDMSRAIVAGKADDQQQKIYSVVYQAQAKAREAVKAGTECKAVDAAARDHIKEAGYGSAFGHATGHGLGLRIHEKPRIKAENESVLSENSVITIEPGIYLEEVGGVRIEDMVVVVNNGSKLLTHSPRKLIELGL
ncbi:aminopeptidase P family protein [Chitinispirillales bacterium ANBcel5]|uniref:aminopeptidase P family protein n=1 Tax=Cellulosispirillum alkaliphilum TaxID=3039283 RepID=UPI002A52E5E7|nr:aminopeptidase P family protein [Chitinispirillales bacterium ANBcel5]